jgi:ABC-type transport system involved in multi-copper enzyme maturation permease subunit
MRPRLNDVEAGRGQTAAAKQELRKVSTLTANARSFGPSALLDVAARLAGPILTKELRVASRRRRTYVLRFVYLAALTAFVAWAWVSEFKWWNAPTPPGLLRMSLIGQWITARIILFQFIALPALAMLGLSTAITEEIQRRTLATLMTTPVTAFRIVLGKLLSQIFQVVLLLAISLPLMVVVRVFGGVPWEAVVLGLEVTLTTCILVGALTLLISTFFRRAYVAVLVTVLALLAAWAGYEAFLDWCFRWRGALASPTEVGHLLVALSPMRWLEMIVPDPSLLATRTAAGLLPWLALLHAAAILALSALLLAWCARRVRRVGLRLATGELRPASRWERMMKPHLWRARRAAAPVQRVTGSPIVWREKRVRFGPSRLAAVVAWAVLCSGLVIADFFAVYEAYWHLAGELALDLFVGYCLALWAVTVLAATVQPAAAFAAEREAQTLSLLLSTPLSSGDIVYDKALGALWRSAPVWGLLMAHVGVFVIFRLVHPIILLLMGLVVAGTLVFTTGAGLFVSAYARRTGAAMATSFMWMLLILGVPLVVGEMSPYEAGSITPASVEGWLHPACQIYMVTQGAADMPGLPGPRRDSSAVPYAEGYIGGNPPPFGKEPLSFVWAYPAGERGWVETTALVGLTSAAWVLAGVGLGDLAARRLRKGT